MYNRRVTSIHSFRMIVLSDVLHNTFLNRVWMTQLNDQWTDHMTRNSNRWSLICSSITYKSWRWIFEAVCLRLQLRPPILPHTLCIWNAFVVDVIFILITEMGLTSVLICIVPLSWQVFAWFTHLVDYHHWIILYSLFEVWGNSFCQFLSFRGSCSFCQLAKSFTTPWIPAMSGMCWFLHCCLTICIRMFLGTTFRKWARDH